MAIKYCSLSALNHTLIQSNPSNALCCVKFGAYEVLLHLRYRIKMLMQNNVELISLLNTKFSLKVPGVQKTFPRLNSSTTATTASF